MICLLSFGEVLIIHLLSFRAERSGVEKSFGVVFTLLQRFLHSLRSVEMTVNGFSLSRNDGERRSVEMTVSGVFVRNDHAGPQGRNFCYTVASRPKDATSRM